MDRLPSEAAPSDPGAFATYAASLAGELSRMAQAHGLTTLAYIFDMARLEARATGIAVRPGDGRRHAED